MEETQYTWKTVLPPFLNIPEKDIELVAKRMGEEMLKMRQALERELFSEPEKETTFPPPIGGGGRGVRIDVNIT